MIGTLKILARIKNATTIYKPFDHDDIDYNRRTHLCAGSCVQKMSYFVHQHGEEILGYQPDEMSCNALCLRDCTDGERGCINKCQEIEINVAQGAKPGEGGQLPGI